MRQQGEFARGTNLGHISSFFGGILSPVCWLAGVTFLEVKCDIFRNGDERTRKKRQE